MTIPCLGEVFPWAEIYSSSGIDFKWIVGNGSTLALDRIFRSDLASGGIKTINLSENEVL